MQLQEVGAVRGSVTIGTYDVVEMKVLEGEFAGKYIDAYLDRLDGPWFTPDLRPYINKYRIPRYDPSTQLNGMK